MGTGSGFARWFADGTRGGQFGRFPLLRSKEPMPVEPIFLRPREAAELAGLSTRAIYGAINRGELPAVRLCSHPAGRVRGVDSGIDRSP